MDVYYRRGLWVELNGKKLLFDPTAKSSLDQADFTFVTHGHSDHASGFKNVASSEILSSDVTAEVLKLRYDVDITTNDFSAQMHNAGHVMGSSQFQIGDVLYTGDLNTAKQLSVDPAHTPAADTLIMEATYGSPENVMPPHEEVLAQIDAFVKDAFSRDRPAVFYAYSLGKAQELSMLLQKYKLFVDSGIYEMNQIYSEKVKKIRCHLLPEGIQFADNHFVAIYTASKMKQNKHLLAKTWGTETPMTAVATGWATVDWFRYGVAKKVQLDGIFPLSSHADFNSLCSFVDAVSPKKVYTVFGSTAELASELCKRGYDAEPVRAIKTQAIAQKCRAY